MMPVVMHTGNSSLGLPLALSAGGVPSSTASRGTPREQRPGRGSEPRLMPIKGGS